MENIKFKIKDLPKLLLDSVSQFIDDKGLKMSTSSVLLYCIFFRTCNVVIVISFVGLFFGENNARIGIVDEATKLIGSDGANMLNTIIKGASNPSAGIFAAVLSIILLMLVLLAFLLNFRNRLISSGAWN
ncbi:MAG: hypothetical protein MZU97_00065 [Bacillus subtilis]|nr:hypothetical protein [Bacillus subtilis]